MVAEILTILTGMCKCIRIIPVEVLLYRTRTCRNHITHWGCHLIVRIGSAIQGCIVAEQRLYGCKGQAFNRSQLLIERHVQGDLLTLYVALRVDEPRHRDS